MRRGVSGIWAGFVGAPRTSARGLTTAAISEINALKDSADFLAAQCTQYRAGSYEYVQSSLQLVKAYYDLGLTSSGKTERREYLALAYSRLRYVERFRGVYPEFMLSILQLSREIDNSFRALKSEKKAAVAELAESVSAMDSR